MAAVITHIRRNAVAYLALFIALGGTSYAAIRVSNHSLTPVKLSPRYFGGYLRGWASVAADGHVGKSSDRPKVEMQSGLSGEYLISWPTKPISSCTAAANVVVGASGPVPGYAIAEASRQRRRDEQSIVHTYNSAGQETPMPFEIALLCSTPR